MKIILLILSFTFCTNVGAKFGVCSYELYQENIKIDTIQKDQYDFECFTHNINDIEYRMTEFKENQ